MESPGQTALSSFGELVFFAASFLFGVGIIQLLLLTGALPDPATSAWVGPVAGPFMMGIAGLVYSVFQMRGDRTARAPIREDKLTVSQTLMVSVSHIALALGGSVLIALVAEAVGVPPEENPRVREIVAGGMSAELVLLGVAALGLAPLLEEWLFRGLLFRRLWHAGNPAIAYGISAVLFALIHQNLSGMLTFIWLGLVFAHAYRRSGRLWSASLVHFGNNAATFALLLGGAS